MCWWKATCRRLFKPRHGVILIHCKYPQQEEIACLSNFARPKSVGDIRLSPVRPVSHQEEDREGDEGEECGHPYRGWEDAEDVVEAVHGDGDVVVPL